ncbi:MAG: prepilin-type N-terminal cleavage/methylation domain-containing protein [Gemmatimonadota bacterium]
MSRIRSGFTLVELLTVMLILGLLAAIALPLLGRTRERAHFRAMQSDLRNLMAQQEAYFSMPVNQRYASNVAAIANFNTTLGVSVVITASGVTGWAATAAHASLQPNQTCAVFYGTVLAIPAPAVGAGVLACTGE